MDVTFLGDVYLPDPVDVTVTFDAYIPNLESPISRASNPEPGKVTLRVDTDHFAASFGTEPLAVNLANNHIMDFGEPGLRDTMAHFDRRGIGYFGAGDLSTGANNPIVVEVDGARIGLMGYVADHTSPIFASQDSPGVVHPTIERIRDDLDQAREMDAQHLVVHLHWGYEDVFLPRPSDVALGRQILAKGADLVIGHHAHRIQPIVPLSNGTIYFGLGNCIMPDIDIPTYFDVAGRPTERYQRTQYGWNRRSLAVDFNPTTGKTRHRALCFDGSTLSRMRWPTKHYILSGYLLRLPPFHATVQPGALAAGKAKRRIRRFREDPTRLTPHNVRLFIRSLREGK